MYFDTLRTPFYRQLTGNPDSWVYSVLDTFGQTNPAPPQQLGEDFRARVREHGGGYRRWSSPEADAKALANSGCSSAFNFAAKAFRETPCEGGKGGNQRRTEEDAPQPVRTVLCWLETCMPAKTGAIQTWGDSSKVVVAVKEVPFNTQEKNQWGFPALLWRFSSSLL